MNCELPYKGWAIMLTDTEANVQKILGFIQAIDPEEFDRYFNPQLLTTKDGFIDFEYVGKFDIDTDALRAKCKEEGIPFEIRFKPDNLFD